MIARIAGLTSGPGTASAPSLIGLILVPLRAGRGDGVESVLHAITLGIVPGVILSRSLLLLLTAPRACIRAVRPFNRMGVSDVPGAVARLARGGERLDKALSHALTRHLDQPERGHFSHLMACPIPA